MEAKLGIKETKEVLIAANEIAVFMIKQLKDGISIADGMAVFQKLVGDKAFQDMVVAAYDGVKNVPAEAKDLDINEGLELATLQIAYVPKIVAAVKGE